MELQNIQAYLDSPNADNRMKAIVELRNYDADVVVPLLRQKMYDKEFVVRSFVAMGFGKKRNDMAFYSLLDLIQYDNDPNVRAESANSLANYGEYAIPYLIELFRLDHHWLVRQSILAVMTEMGTPEQILQLSRWALAGDDLTVKLNGISILGRLDKTELEMDALALLSKLATSEITAIRIEVAITLRYFNCPQAQTIIAQLRKDPDHRVLGAILEGTIKM